MGTSTGQEVTLRKPGMSGRPGARATHSGPGFGLEAGPCTVGASSKRRRESTDGCPAERRRARTDKANRKEGLALVSHTGFFLALADVGSLGRGCRGVANVPTSAKDKGTDKASSARACNV